MSKISEYLPSLFAFSCVSLVVYDVVVTGSPISFASALLMLVATLPWAWRAIDSFSFSNQGVSAQLRTVEALIERETESGSDEAAFRLDSKSEKYLILRALMDGQYSMRSVTGIRKQLNFEAMQVSALLQELQDAGLTLQVEGKSGPRWIITSSGMDVVRLPVDEVGQQYHQEGSDNK